MNRTRDRVLIAVLMPFVLILTACGVNSIPTAEENAKAKWADVQNYYQRRSDLIPNLVATVRAAAAQERNVLREVTEARASATRVTVSPEQLTDPAAMNRYAEAQQRLTLSLQRLQEAYPELHSNQNFPSSSRSSKAPRTGSPPPATIITGRSRPIIPRSGPSRR